MPPESYSAFDGLIFGAEFIAAVAVYSKAGRWWWRTFRREWRAAEPNIGLACGMLFIAGVGVLHAGCLVHSTVVGCPLCTVTDDPRKATITVRQSWLRQFNRDEVIVPVEHEHAKGQVGLNEAAEPEDEHRQAIKQ